MLAMLQMQEELMAGLRSELTETQSELRAENSATHSENATFKNEVRKEIMALNDQFGEEKWSTHPHHPRMKR